MLESGVSKLLHAPTTKLKARAADGNDAGELAAAVRFLFDLEEAEASAQAARGEGENGGDEDDRLPN
jgi:hypothetical protein